MYNKKVILNVLSILFLLTCPILLYCQESIQLNQTSADLFDKDTIVINRNKSINDKDTLPFTGIDDSEIVFFSENGQRLFKNYIRTNLNYPNSEIDNKIEGQVIVCFEFDNKGKPFNIKMKKSLNTEFDNEVIRVISNLPNYGWTNGRQITEYKPFQICMPITFKLQ